MICFPPQFNTELPGGLEELELPVRLSNAAQQNGAEQNVAVGYAPGIADEQEPKEMPTCWQPKELLFEGFGRTRRPKMTNGPMDHGPKETKGTEGTKGAKGTTSVTTRLAA